MTTAEPGPADPKPKPRWFRYGLLALLAIIFVCSMPWDLWLFVRPASTPLTETAKPDGKKTYEEFAAAIKSYPYEASQARKDRIVKNYPRLEAGMSKDQIAGLIGDPDYSQLEYAKEPSDRAVGSSWMYYLRKRDNGVSLIDPCVQMFFGTDGWAYWIVPSNIGGLKEKGSYLREGRPPSNTGRSQEATKADQHR